MLDRMVSPHMLDPSMGKSVGTHNGAHFFTIGQRKGINVGGHEEPLFVIATDVEKNIIYVGEGQSHPGLYIHAIQSRPQRSEQKQGINRLAPYAPGFLRRAFFRVLLKNPFWVRKFTGTTILTSVGMFGNGAGWGIAFLPWYTTGVTIGGIAEKPAWIGGRVEPREYLSVTLTFDHDIIDGAPAARFANTFKEYVESACES